MTNPDRISDADEAWEDGWRRAMNEAIQVVEELSLSVCTWCSDHNPKGIRIGDGEQYGCHLCLAKKYLEKRRDEGDGDEWQAKR